MTEMPVVSEYPTVCFGTLEEEGCLMDKLESGKCIKKKYARRGRTFWYRTTLQHLYRDFTKKLIQKIANGLRGGHIFYEKIKDGKLIDTCSMRIY